MDKYKINKKIDILFGKKAKYTHFGIKGYSRYGGCGFEYYVYGIEKLFNIIIDKRWGEFNQDIPKY